MEEIIITEGNNGSYLINGKDANSIHGIEALTMEECEAFLKVSSIDSKEEIKGHTVYFLEFNGYFGYSALVFLNGKHIYYADDFQLHHKYKNYVYDEEGNCTKEERTMEDLKEFYIEEMNNKLFTLEELQFASSYDEYKKKDYYLRNYWIMQFDRLSMFCISGSDEEKKFDALNAEYLFANNYSFCYMKDENIVNMQLETARKLESSYKNILSDSEKFRKAIRYELRNHEACITMEPHDALEALGLSWKRLSDEFRAIVANELNKCIDEYANAE